MLFFSSLFPVGGDVWIGDNAHDGRLGIAANLRDTALGIGVRHSRPRFDWLGRTVRWNAAVVRCTCRTQRPSQPPRPELAGLPQILLTPHISGSGDTKMAEPLRGLFAENLRRYLDGQPLLNVVDRARGY